MYYEEKVIGDVLHFRLTPKGNFTPMSAKNLTTKLLAARKEVEKITHIINSF